MQKLTRNGNSTSVSIARPILTRLGWLPGRAVVVELTESCDMLIVRLPNERDFGVVGPPRVLLDNLEAKS